MEVVVDCDTGVDGGRILTSSLGGDIRSAVTAAGMSLEDWAVRLRPWKTNNKKCSAELLNLRNWYEPSPWIKRDD